MIGKISDYFVVGDQVGRGSFGVVYRAKPLPLGRSLIRSTIGKGRAIPREVVLKEIRLDLAGSADLDIFVREVTLLRSYTMGIPGVVQYYGCALAREDEVTRYYVVMEYIDGVELFDFMTEVRNQDRIDNVAAQAFEIVHRVHEAGLVHRDIKLENFMIDREDRLTLIDFGLSCLLKARAEQEADIGAAGGGGRRSGKRRYNLERLDPLRDMYCRSGLAGTAIYTSPVLIEKYRLKQPLTPGDLVYGDWWSLAVTIYQLYHKVTPFRGTMPKRYSNSFYNFHQALANGELLFEINTSKIPEWVNRTLDIGVTLQGSQRRQAAQGSQRRQAAQGSQRRQAAQGSQRRQAAQVGQGSQRHQAAQKK